MRMTKTNPLFTKSFLPHGNGKLLDYDDSETGIKYRYAQFNTRAIKDCPFRSSGCESVCYATKGNHQFSDVKNSREKSFQETRSENFVEKMIYTIHYHLNSKRYNENIMIVRIHESGDFYSVQYLKRWVMIWKEFENESNIKFVFYTKSFPFFLMLSKSEKEIIRNMMKKGNMSINLSTDDTTDKKQIVAYLNMISEFPLANSYRVTEKYTEKDDKCDCENCAKCGACNKATGKEKVVAIHSASKADIEKYRKNKAGRV